MMRWGLCWITILAVISSGCSEGDTSGDGDRGAGAAGPRSASGDGDGDGDQPAGDGDDFGNTGSGSPNLPALDGGFRDAAAAGDPDDDDCGGIEVEPEIMMEVVPGNLLLVFDRSGSMDQSWSGTTGNAKWDDAIAAIPAAMMPLQDLVTAAAVFFPYPDDCDVPAIGAMPQIDFVPGPDFLTAWGGFTSMGGPNGRTPLRAALGVADQALQSFLPTAVGVTNVIIVTDGQPNCVDGIGGNDDSAPNLKPLIETWLTQGVQTHVVGLPGVSDAVTLLNELAVAGGTGQYISADDPMMLQDALAKIIGESVSTNFDSCSIGLPNAPPNLDDVALTVVEGGQRQAVARDLGTGGGWTITPDGSTIILQGLFCDLAQQGEYDQIAVVFGCVDLPPLPPPRPE